MRPLSKEAGGTWRSVVRATAVGLLPLATGCFAYAPARGVILRPDSEVRAHLGTPLKVDAGAVSVNNVQMVDGRVVRSGSDSLVLSAMRLSSSSGQQFPGDAVTVAIPRASLSSLEQRRFSPERTALVVGTTALMYLLIQSALPQGGSKGGGGNGGGTTQ